MTECYVKTLCISLKKLIRLYKMDKQLKLLSKLTSVRVLCVFHLLQLFFLDKSKTVLSLFVHT